MTHTSYPEMTKATAGLSSAGVVVTVGTRKNWTSWTYGQPIASQPNQPHNNAMHPEYLQYIYLAGSDKRQAYGWFSNAHGDQPYDPKDWPASYQSTPVEPPKLPPPTPLTP